MTNKIRLVAMSTVATFAFLLLVFSAGMVKAEDSTTAAYGAGYGGFGGLGTPFYSTTTTSVNLPCSQLTYTNTTPYYFIPTYLFAGAGCYGGSVCGGNYGCGGYGLGGYGLGSCGLGGLGGYGLGGFGGNGGGLSIGF